MPQRKSGKTELKKNIKRKKRNLFVKTQVKKTIKKLKKSLQDKNAELIKDNLKTAYKIIDKAAAKKAIHPNNAARKKSRITKLVNKAATA